MLQIAHRTGMGFQRTMCSVLPWHLITQSWQVPLLVGGVLNCCHSQSLTALPHQCVLHFPTFLEEEVTRGNVGWTHMMQWRNALWLEDKLSQSCQSCFSWHPAIHAAFVCFCVKTAQYATLLEYCRGLTLAKVDHHCPGRCLGKTLISAGNSIGLGSWNAAHAGILDTCRGASQSFLVATWWQMNTTRWVHAQIFILYWIWITHLLCFVAPCKHANSTDGNEDHTLGPWWLRCTAYVSSWGIILPGAGCKSTSATGMLNSVFMVVRLNIWMKKTSVGGLGDVLL